MKVMNNQLRKIKGLVPGIIIQAIILIVFKETTVITLNRLLMQLY